jgi:YfiH family protein
MPMPDLQPSDGFRWKQAEWGAVLECVPLAAIAEHCFTTRDVDFKGRDAEDAAWRALGRAIGADERRVLRLRQVHGHAVARISAVDASAVEPPEADVAIADCPRSAIVVQAADCVPLLIADSRLGVVAAAHAGWRGTAVGVAEIAVGALRDAFGARPGDLVVAIGPSIDACCYEVGEDVRTAFFAGRHSPEDVARWFNSEAGAARSRIDLRAANRDQLAAAGVRPENVFVSALCTACHPESFFSYRRDGASTGRLAAAIRARG